MPNFFEVTYEGQFVKAISDGDKDIEVSTAVWTEIVRICKEHDCFNVLGISNTTKVMEAVDGYDHARLFRELEIGGSYRIAWVERNPDAVDLLSFIETVLQNRGLPGRVFNSVDDAMTWLLEDASFDD